MNEAEIRIEEREKCAAALEVYACYYREHQTGDEFAGEIDYARVIAAGLTRAADLLRGGAVVWATEVSRFLREKR